MGRSAPGTDAGFHMPVQVEPLSLSLPQHVCSSLSLNPTPHAIRQNYIGGWKRWPDPLGSAHDFSGPSVRKYQPAPSCDGLLQLN